MKDYFRYFDKFSFLLLLILAVSGVFFIYSASRPMATPYHLKQLFFLVLSLGAFFLFTAIKLEVLFQKAWIGYLLLLALLVLHVLVGRTVAGTKSWFRIGILNAQFSEFVKIPLTLYLAKYLTTFDDIGWKVLLKLLAVIGLPVLLISLQPDLGVSFILCSLLVLAILLKRIQPAVLVISLLLVASLAVVGWNYYLKPYQKNRIISFLNPEKYQSSIGYQVIQSKIAIGSGGLTGKGYLKGSQSQYKFLPTRHTDFIVAVIGEEFGFLTISLLFFIYLIFFYRQLRSRFTNDEEFYFVFLFTGLVMFQFMVNALMVIGFFPVLGIPLPFISYGGSSLLSFFIGEAIIFRIRLNCYLT